ncbi:MAG: pilin, partial [Patescibacteria group bacterium]
MSIPRINLKKSTFTFIGILLGSFLLGSSPAYSKTEFQECVEFCGGAGCYYREGRPDTIKKCDDLEKTGNAEVICNKYGEVKSECANKCRGKSAGKCPNFENPLKTANVPELVGNFFRAFFGLIGVIALVIFIYGGLLWMTSMGEEERVKRGRETMIWAGAGLIAILGSYAVVQFILRTVLNEPRPAAGTPTTSAPAGSTSVTSSASSSSGTTSGATASPAGTSAG